MDRKAPRPASPDAVLLRPEEAAHALGVGRARIYDLTGCRAATARSAA